MIFCTCQHHRVKPPQKFSLYSKDMPGFNEMIAAAKQWSNSSQKKGSASFNGYQAMKKKWSEKIVAVIQKESISPIDKLFLKMVWIEPSKRRDPDNIASFIKFILDALQKAGVIENDGWKQVKGWTNSFIIGEDRGVEVNLYEYETNDESAWKF